MRFAICSIAAVLICACSAKSSVESDMKSDATDASSRADAMAEIMVPTTSVKVTVLLDGEPGAGITVSQGGREDRWTTAEDGTVTVDIDRTVEGDMAIIASYPEARIEAEFVWEDTTEVTIKLERFDLNDNESYLFQNPGMPGHSPTSAQCGHCHHTIADDFFNSQHPWTTSSPTLQDLYAGTASHFDSEASCDDAGGAWLIGIQPGTLEEVHRCYLGAGVLPALNEQCEDGTACDSKATSFGPCANCHAPGIDGKLGGRNLLDATGYSYERGVHCDVCHHVESIDDDAPAGVAGRLKILRPSDPSTTPSFGQWRPLLFGPHDDIPNPFMGIVQRLVYQESRFCGGCHQMDQPVLLPGEEIDKLRWPSGSLPIHSTFAEWQASGMSVTCQGCHMPHDQDVANTADLQLFPTTVGVAGGWYRPIPSVRRHIWYGPRSEDSPLHPGAAGLEIETELVAGVFNVSVTTKNKAVGHALPSGEPMRNLVLLVEARCAGEILTPVGGDVVPDFGGYLDARTAQEDWSVWPGASAGDKIRVISRTGQYHDYAGIGPFGDGTFKPEEKGLPVEQFVGEVTVLSVDGDSVTLDAELPAGDVAYRVQPANLPAHGDPVVGTAGAPGFGFARVLTGAKGDRMVPHFMAIDVASDNRLMTGVGWQSNHQFAATCDQPTARAVLSYRRFAVHVARQKGWEQTESLLADETN